MEKLKFNPNNKKYYSEEFIKGFECGVERQFNADMEDNTAEWKEDNEDYFCSKCGYKYSALDEDGCPIPDNYCPNCGCRMKGV